MKRTINHLCLLLILLLTGCGIKHPYVQEYIPGTGNIQGNVDTASFTEHDARFEIGADKEGVAVFKDPDAAYEALIEHYSDGIALIQKEFNLPRISKHRYDGYKTYGWQVTTGSESERKDARFVSRFLDIYENSFR